MTNPFNLTTIEFMDPLVYKIFLALSWLVFFLLAFYFYFGPAAAVLKKLVPDRTDDKFSVALFGDCQGADNPFTSRRLTYFVFNHVLEQVNKEQPLFTVILGDIVSSGRAYHFRRFQRQLAAVRTPVYLVLGNHDAKYRGREIFSRLFGPAYYSFSVGSNHFLALDNADGTIREEQMNWLGKELQKHPDKNLYVFLHQPLFDPRPGENYAMSDTAQAARLKELFLQHKVKAVFSSHLHGYYTALADGVSYYITGGAGSTLTSPHDFYHYITLDINGDGFNVTVHKVPADLSWPLLWPWFAGLLSFVLLTTLTFFAPR